MGRETVDEVQDGLGDPRGSPGRDGGPLGRSGMGQTLGEVWDGFGGPSGRFMTGRESLGAVRNVPVDPRECLGRVGGPLEKSGSGWGDPWGDPGRVRRPRGLRNGSGRSGTGRGTIGVIRDGSGDHWGGPGRVGGPLGMFGTSWGNLGEIRDISGDPW